MTLNLFSAPLARLLEQGAQLVEVARALGQPEAQISHDGQVLTLRRSDLRRVLVYRIELTSLFWMVLLPDNTHQCTFSGIDQSLGFDRLADRLQEALR